MDEGPEADVVQLGYEGLEIDDAGPTVPMSREAARQITTEAFRRILKRPPDESALDAYSNALLAEVLTPREMFIELVESEEFQNKHSNSSMPLEDARAFTTEAFRRILNREPEESALDAYSGDLLAGALTPLDLLLDLIGSEEFRRTQSMSVEAARSFTAETFRLILQREAEDSAVASYSSALLTAALTPLGLIRELIESEEFGVGAQRHPVVARHIAQAVVAALMKEDPGSEIVSAYAQSLENGHSLENMIRQTMRSDEFLYPDIGLLAEHLIVAHLVEKGLHMPAPPRQLEEKVPISEDRMRAMLHTLAMLAH